MEDKKVLNNEELEKVNGGICWPVKYAVDLSKPQCGIDGNNGCPGGGISREKIELPIPADCGLIP